MMSETARLLIERVQDCDGEALIAANRASVALHEPWVSPCRDRAGFETYLASCDGQRKIGFIARDRENGQIVGVVNISEIIRGPLQSAFLGYFGTEHFQGRGLMREALAWAIGHAFTVLDLHRLEANIQPGNAASLALVQRLGFRREGFSPRYLKIGGEWRDHERWALLTEDWVSPEAVNERPA
jgi:ribosomal-protein-alanine N-acetyltransferase